MRVKIDEELREWLVYNEKKFRLELKSNAPTHIIKKFNEHRKAFKKTVEINASY